MNNHTWGVVVMEKEITEKSSIDAVDFAILSFLAAAVDGYGTKELRDLLEQYVEVELSKTPFARRMRELAKDGYVTEDTKGKGHPSLYHLTEEGKVFCISWAEKLQMLAALSIYTLTEEEDVSEEK